MAETHKQVFRETVPYQHDVPAFVKCLTNGSVPRTEASWWWRYVTCEKCRLKAPRKWREKWENER